MKKRFKTFLYYHWYYYLLIICIVTFFYYYLFSVLRLPNSNNCVNIFIESTFVDKNKLESHLNELNTNSNIEKISIDYSDPNDTYYQTVFMTRGLVNTDILILNETHLASIDYANYFISLNDSIMSNYVNIEKNIKCYLNGDNYYGYAFKNNSILKCEEYITYLTDINYYLLINKSSEKLGQLNDDSINDIALSVVGLLLNEK